MTQRPLLAIQGLQKAYSEQTPSFCAEIENLILYPGQVLGITGQSGCGKSTLLELLALLIKPDHAECFLLQTSDHIYDIKDLWKNKPSELALLRRKDLGFVHQAGGLYPFLRCRENIALPLLMQHHPKKERDARINELLHFLKIEHVADRFPEQLSYGERQRTAIARALVHRPSLILADEPTSSLDPESAKTAMLLLCEGAIRSNASLLVVSHDLALLKASDIPTIPMSLAADSNKVKRRYVLREKASASAVLPNENGDQNAFEKKRKNKACPWWLPIFLAWRDFFFEYALSICAVLAFAAALTPMLVLGGLRNGVVTTLTQRFLNNPGALAIHPYSTSRYTEQDIEELRKLHEVAFVVPMTRSLASTVLIPRKGRPSTSADVVPTAEGDPLLLRYTSIPGQGESVITQELARSLGDAASIGKDIDLVVTRRVQGRDERVSCSVRIVGILPDAADWKAHVYLPFPLLQAMERYRDGIAVPELQWPGTEEKELTQSYAGFRMYVQNPEAVLSIRDILKKRGIDAWTAAREVETIQKLQSCLSLITFLVGGVTLTGMALSLGSLAIGNVRRKARLIAQGHLMGLRRSQILSVPLIQMTLISFLATTCSLCFYALVSQILNFVASPWLLKGEVACQLDVVHFAYLYAGSFLLSCICGVFASSSLLSLQPAEVLRREN